MAHQPTLALNRLRVMIALERDKSLRRWERVTNDEALLRSLDMSDEDLLSLTNFGRNSLRWIRKLAGDLDQDPFGPYGLVRLD